MSLTGLLWSCIGVQTSKCDFRVSVVEKITTKVNGLASAIMFEIFRRRGPTGFFGQCDVTNIISESGGWFALRDKLL
jgi:hypothetical protein